MVLKIRVMNYGQFCRGVRESRSNCCRFSLVGVVPEKEPFQSAGKLFSYRELKFAQDCRRLVGRTVVHDNDFDAIQQRRLTHNFEPFETSTDQVLLVVHRNKNRKCRRGFH